MGTLVVAARFALIVAFTASAGSKLRGLKALPAQMRAFGIRYEPPIAIPDLIELVFTAQERFMNVEPEEVNRVPTLEELEAYFEETRVA